MKVCAVIVTYGDRFPLLKQVIDACYKEGVNKIIVVDNASTENSKMQLDRYEKLNKDKLKVISLDENTGSAGGYKIGLQEAYKDKDCEFIWLLDDDNKPKENSLNVLKDFWSKIYIPEKNRKIALLSFRPDRNIYQEAITKSKPDLVLGKKNSFLGFHIIDLPQKIIKFLIKKFNKNKFVKTTDKKNGSVPVAPYGGLFFHKNLIKNIGYPKEEFFVYSDDHEWSYRITKNGGKIILILDSELEDIDTSWNIKNQKNKTTFSLIAKGNPFRIYYYTRNRIIFEKDILVTNKIVYKLNMFLFNAFLSLVRGKKKKSLKAFKKAIRDAEKNKLGRINENTDI